MSGFFDKPDPPQMQIGSQHIGDEMRSPYALDHNPHSTNDMMPRKVQLLAAKLGLQWCDQHSIWEEIAGGSSATWKNEIYGTDRSSDSMPNSAPQAL